MSQALYISPYFTYLYSFHWSDLLICHLVGLCYCFARFSDKKACKSEKILSELGLKVLAHEVSSPDLETKIGPASRKIMKWIKFDFQTLSPSSSFPMAQLFLSPIPRASSIITGSLAWVCEVSPGVELDVELQGADINFNVLIEGCFVSWRKWWKKLRSRRSIPPWEITTCSRYSFYQQLGRFWEALLKAN